MSVTQRHGFNIHASWGMLPSFNKEAWENAEKLWCNTADGSDTTWHRRSKAIFSCTVLHTACQSHSPIAIEFHEDEPGLDLVSWEPVTESSLALPSGQLFVEAGWVGIERCAQSKWLRPTTAGGRTTPSLLRLNFSKASATIIIQFGSVR